MIKALLLSSVFLFNMAAFVAEASAADPCAHIRNRPKCDDNPECFWDVDDRRCESRISPTPGECGRIKSEDRCVEATGCFWDDVDERCEREPRS